MLPFLLHLNRAKYVRFFMDDYTEQRARYPKMAAPDFIGHSNGSYILAAALKEYATLSVGNVYLAGSVLPQRYDWNKLLDGGRVKKVYNVMGSCDWVVAIFPRLFEQVAEWLSYTFVDAPSTDGVFDIGAAGFRGFADAKTGRDRIDEIMIRGGHSAGINHRVPETMTMAATFVVGGELAGNSVTREYPNAILDNLSNVSWLVWIALIVSAVALGYFTWWGFGLAIFASWIKWVALSAYVLVLVLVLSSV